MFFQSLQLRRLCVQNSTNPELCMSAEEGTVLNAKDTEKEVEIVTLKVGIVTSAACTWDESLSVGVNRRD